MSSPLVAKSPMGLGLNGEGAAALLAGFAGSSARLHGPSSLGPQGPAAAAAAAKLGDQEMGDGEARINGVSRKDKSLGLLCDNFLQHFASVGDTGVELEAVASNLGVGRRRIYDIVNVLESLDVVQKDKASSYTWLGISKLPACVEALSQAEPIVPLLVDEPRCGSAAAEVEADSENAQAENMGGNNRRLSAGGEKLEGRKEKSIRELSTKFVSLFLQSTNIASLDSTVSLEQAARCVRRARSLAAAHAPSLALYWANSRTRSPPPPCIPNTPRPAPGHSFSSTTTSLSLSARDWQVALDP